MYDKRTALAAICVMYAAAIVFPRKKAYITLAAAALVMLFGITRAAEALVRHVNWNM
jgi:hypothetical protein